jgi:hypothetical protein
VKITTYLHLVPRSRKYGSVHPLPHTPTWRSALSVKHREDFTFLLHIYSSTALVDIIRFFFFSFLIYTQPVGLLGRWISPSQGRYFHTEQHKHRLNARKHPRLDWDSNPLSQCSSGRRWFMPYTARPLSSGLEDNFEYCNYTITYHMHLLDY